MEASFTQQYDRPPTLSDIALLRPMDRVILNHNGSKRVAKVSSHYHRGGVRKLTVWLKKNSGYGFCSTTTTVRCRDIVDVTYSKKLRIDYAAGERSLLEQLIGGVA